MGKSYRKPYSAITGAGSAHDDKTVAARMVRRAQNHALRTAIANHVDWDEFLLPEVYECSHNDVWGWGRDGKQHLQFPPKPTPEGIWNGYSFTGPDEWYERALRWYKRIQRK